MHVYDMKGKKVNARTRIKCPLCGNLGWQSQFERENPLVKVLYQYSTGFKKIVYSESTDEAFLSQVLQYLTQKVEDLYERLTGINIQELIKLAGGDLKRSEQSYVLTVPVEKSYSWKMELPSNSEKISVTPSLSLKRVGKKNIIR